MEPVFWFGFPVVIAVGTAVLVYVVMHARMQAALAKERGLLAETEARLHAETKTAEERVRAAVEDARRRALEELFGEFRVEERHYFRDQVTAQARRKSMVLQERLYFRNIPLSNWIEHEMLVEDSAAAPAITGSNVSVFRPRPAPVESEVAVRLYEAAV